MFNLWQNRSAHMSEKKPWESGLTVHGLLTATTLGALLKLSEDADTCMKIFYLKCAAVSYIGAIG